MGYQYKGAQTAAPTQSVEQARRINAELRRELERLAVENAQLGPSVETLRLQVTAARKKLTRQIRELEAARIQTERLANTTSQVSTLPEPIYGGRAGLEAATAEIEAHEARNGKLGTVTRKGPQHGTGRKYAAGCRCNDCQGWRERRTKSQRATQERRRAERLAAA